MKIKKNTKAHSKIGSGVGCTVKYRRTNKSYHQCDVSNGQIHTCCYESFFDARFTFHSVTFCFLNSSDQVKYSLFLDIIRLSLPLSVSSSLFVKPNNF